MERGIDLKLQVRLKVLADIVSEQAQTIIQQAEQIGNLNEMNQTLKSEVLTLKNPPISEPPKS